MKYAIISTEKGDMKAELYEKETPITVEYRGRYTRYRPS